MLDLVKRMIPGAQAVEEQQGTGRVRHLRITLAGGGTRPCVLRRAPARELALYETHLSAPATGAPALLGSTPAGEREVWLLLEGLPEVFPDYAVASHITAVYQHLAQMHTHFISSGKLSDTYAQVIAQFSPKHAEKAQLLAEGPTTLVHGDYHRWNLLLTGGRVRVLDWELAAFTSPIWDLTLLAPEEPGWDGVPRGARAEEALRIYHEAGPFARLPYSDFICRQRLARLYIAARWTVTHRAKAAALPRNAVRAEIEAYAEAEYARVQRLLTQL